MNKYTEQIAKNVTSGLSEIILMALPDNGTMQKISSIQHGHNGKIVYSYDGVDFLEVWPPEVEYTREGNSYILRATQKYRIIKGDAP